MCARISGSSTKSSSSKEKDTTKKVRKSLSSSPPVEGPPLRSAVTSQPGARASQEPATLSPLVAGDDRPVIPAAGGPSARAEVPKTGVPKTVVPKTVVLQTEFAKTVVSKTAALKTGVAAEAAPLSQSLEAQITIDVSHDEISHRAWEIWNAEGRPNGCEVEHWLRAERELRSFSQ